MRALVLLIRPYLPGGRLMDHFYSASNAAYHAAKEMADRIAAECGIRAERCSNLKLKPMCRRHPSFGTGKNTLNYLPGIGSRFCMELLGLSEPVDTELAAPYPKGELPCGDCGRCAAACPTKAITADGFVKERCIRFHMMSGKPMPEEMRGLVGSDAGTRGVLGCDICQRVCPANTEIEKYRTAEDAFTLEELLECTGDTLERFAALYGRNYANRNRILAQAVLAAGNHDPEKYREQIQQLAQSPSPALSEHAQYVLKNMKK